MRVGVWGRALLIVRVSGTVRDNSEDQLGSEVGGVPGGSEVGGVPGW